MARHGFTMTEAKSSTNFRGSKWTSVISHQGSWLCFYGEEPSLQAKVLPSPCTFTHPTRPSRGTPLSLAAWPSLVATA